MNGRKTNIPSCLVKPGDVIEWRKASTKSEYYKIFVERIEDKDVPVWLSLDKESMVGRVVSLPSREDIKTNFDEKAIVEYYSR